jgi:hypothetical protein
MGAGSVGHMGSTRSRGSWIAVVGAVATRPRLWPTAVGQIFRLSPTGWWRRAPYVPRPDPAYVRFRVATQYGGTEAAAPDPHDVVEYLSWCRSLGTSLTRPR